MSLTGLDLDHWKDFKFNPERIKKMQAGSEIIINFINIALSQGLLRSDLLSTENLIIHQTYRYTDSDSSPKSERADRNGSLPPKSPNL